MTTGAFMCRFLAAAVCGVFCVNIQAATILKYAPVEAGKQRLEVVVPVSAFHNAELADREAAKILQAWQVDAVTVPWTRVQLASYVKHKMMPTRGARGLALLHVAMHDALELAEEANLDVRLTVSMAAAQVLGYLFVAEEKNFDRIALSLAKQIYKSDVLPASAQDALALGSHVGQLVVRHGDTDGAQKGWNGLRLQYYGENRYYGPGAWEPTPPYFYYPPDEPFAPGWRTWVLSSASEFRPVPPAYGSPKYLQDLEEVIATARSLSSEQRKIATFWVDGHGSVTPPGHWNNIAIDEVKAAKLDNRTTARLFAQMNVAMADTFVAVWDAKYHYWTARPVTASKYVLGTDFKSVLLTPPFPSYVSGHAGFSGAAAHVIGAYFPERAKQLEAMAEEAAYSRLLGGIHFRHDNEDGLVLGRKIAEKVLTTLSP